MGSSIQDVHSTFHQKFKKIIIIKRIVNISNFPMKKTPDTKAEAKEKGLLCQMKMYSTWRQLELCVVFFFFSNAINITNSIRYLQQHFLLLFSCCCCGPFKCKAYTIFNDPIAILLFCFMSFIHIYLQCKYLENSLHKTQFSTYRASE